MQNTSKKYFSNEKISALKNLMLLEKEVQETSASIKKTSKVSTQGILGFLFVFILLLTTYIHSQIYSFMYLEEIQPFVKLLSSINLTIPFSIILILVIAFVLQKKIDTLKNKKVSIVKSIRNLCS